MSDEHKRSTPGKVLLPAEVLKPGRGRVPRRRHPSLLRRLAGRGARRAPRGRVRGRLRGGRVPAWRAGGGGGDNITAGHRGLTAALSDGPS